jgi:hypothetical protein
VRVLLSTVAIAMPCSLAIADNLPIPPIPPEHPPLADVAPVPNVDAEAPVAAPTSGPSVNVRVYRVKIYDPGAGFAPGSRYESVEDRKPVQTPGFIVSVPFK